MFDNKEKIILDLVTFDDIKINYYLANDVQVIFTIDPSVSASTRDWIGIYQAGWNSFESCLTYQWGIGRHYKNACRTRTLTFKAKDLTRAKCGTHYQFVYVSKYLEILGVSQYFQFFGPETPVHRPISGIRSKSVEYVSPLSCKLSLPDQVNNVFTTCGKCEGLFELKEVAKICKETSFTLAAKVTNLERSVSNLQTIPKPTPLVRFWDEESERARFETFVSQIYVPPKPDCSGEKSSLPEGTARAGVLRHLLAALDDIICKANEVKAELVRWSEAPAGGGESGLIDPNASGILPISDTSEELLISETKPDVQET